ncbi:MAG TPA: dephospho-CoA kinase [Gemmatimonadaceae bacterium]|nr:dephospho-CoA kinase [Gemmatimonadaceae bacterium]
MLIVGLTGNIASGKSAVAAQLASLGALIIDADILAREAVEPGRPALAAIETRWGRGVLRRDGSLDRAALRRIVFADPAERAALDAIVHPAVARLRHAAVETARRRGEPLVVCDIPLLFEAGLEGTVDRIVLVDAPAEVRRDRIVRDRGLSPEEADAMIAAQMPSEAKRARAHYVIDNDGALEELEARVDALWEWMQQEASASSA